MAEKAVSPEARAADTATELSVTVGQLMRRLRAESPEGALTPTQRSVMGRLDRDGPATTAALARAEHVRPQSMRLTLGALEEQGMVTRAPHPTDGRQVVFSLTPDGRNGVTSVRHAKQTWLAEAIANALDPREQRTLTEAVALLKRLAES
ncbi:MarR family winged helix-turn-helix transcriptional regulator [Streptantibioticus ferralitis]|uniref:MarR family transcriptional regulator n=1 Tax=Streptantibioticus ferralitis TaxID=236510 RepID=A0ABT5Z3K0_9ACTN|nr:MarR family transcriptional regulator [Streptantibioticus ferralitis]MDF2258151.1 MarR family transcriptional regulator [Streptantibioticus ferralitis]